MVLAREASQILGLYLNGNDPGDIEKQTGCSISTVRAFLSGFDDEVLETLRSFRDLSSELDDTPEVVDALEGAKLNEELGRFGLDRSDLESYVEFCDKASNGSPDLIREAVRLSELEEETGVGYGELVEEHESLLEKTATLSEEVEGLEAEKESLEAEVREAEERLETRIEETGIELERLDRVESLREELEERGKDLDDLEELAVFFRNCEEMGFDPKQVSRMVDLHARLQKFGVEPSEISDYLRRNARLDDLGFTIEAASRLAERLDEIDSDPVEAAEKLAGRFEESELVERQLSELRDRRERLRKKVEDIEETVDALERETASVKEEVDGLEDRRQQLLDREVQLKSKISDREEELEDVVQRINEIAESEDLVNEINELHARREELEEIIEDLEEERDIKPDADIDSLYLKVKEQRDELFQACVDLFEESSTALVLLVTEDRSTLDRLSQEELAKLHRRLQVLKSQDEFDSLPDGAIHAAETAVTDRLDDEEAAIEETVDGEGFSTLGDLRVL